MEHFTTITNTIAGALATTAGAFLAVVKAIDIIKKWNHPQDSGQENEED